MRALVFDGRPAVRDDHPEPLPGPGECVVRVHLAGICATDLHIINGYMAFRGVLGHEMVGTVEAGPPSLLGRRVVGEINCVCRKCDMCQSGLAPHCRERTVMGILGRDGCFAEYVALPERNLHIVPDALDDEEAVFVEPLAAAHQVLVQCPIDERTCVSVVGTGKLGLLIVQVLKGTGCRLTAVGRNREKLERCEKKGVQGVHVDDVVARRDRDVVVECSGTPEGMATALRLVKPRGTVILKSTYAGAGAIDLAPVVIDEVQVIGSRCGPFPEAINSLSRRAVEVRSMVTRVYPLREALRALEHARDRASMKILLKN